MLYSIDNESPASAGLFVFVDKYLKCKEKTHKKIP